MKQLIQILFILLPLASIQGQAADHQIKIDDSMSKDSSWLMLSETAAGQYKGRGKWSYLLSDHFPQYALLAGRSGGQLLTGGTGTTDDLTFRTTSGVGASGSDMIFQVGNNGGTEAMRILYNGAIGINITNPAEKLELSGKLKIYDPSFASHSALISVARASSTQSIYAQNLTSTETANMDMIVRYIPVGSTGRTAYQVWGTSNISNGVFMGFAHLNTTSYVGSFNTGTGVLTPLEIRVGANTVATATTSAQFGIGTTSTSAKLHVIATTEQQRTGYNTSNYYSTTVGSSGDVTFNAVGAGQSFTFSDDVNVPSEAYGAPWNGSNEAPTKDALYDLIATYLMAGTYTPTISNEVNEENPTTITDLKYSRVQNVITVSGLFTFDADADDTHTSFEITLPIASDIVNAEDVAGTATMMNLGDKSMHSATITGNTGNNTAEFNWWPETCISSQTWSFVFTYIVQ